MSGNKMSNLKNLLWSFAIVLCVAAIVVGIVVACAHRYRGEGFNDSAVLSGESVKGNNDFDGATQTGASGLLTLAQTNDAGQEYIDKLTFLCDSSLIGLRDYGILSGGTGTTQVWGTDVGTLKVNDLASGTIIFPSDKSSISIGDAAMVAKPKILVICVGQDGLGEVDEGSFKQNYSAMLQGIKASSPDTVIICCGATSVDSAYTGVDNLTVELVAQANKWITDVCAAEGVYYLSTATVVGDGTGALLSSYVSTNGKTLNSKGINEILSFLSTHALNVG